MARFCVKERQAEASLVIMRLAPWAPTQKVGSSEAYRIVSVVESGKHNHNEEIYAGLKYI